MTENAASGLVVVAGATGVIGSAVCRMLAERHVRVLALSRKGGVLVDGADELQCDLSCPEGPARLLHFLTRRSERVRGLVSCLPAGLCPRPAVGGADIALVEALAPLLAEQGGSVVMLSSTAAQRPFATGRSRFYAAEKGAIEAYVRAAAGELAPVRINAVAPGIVAGPHARGGVHDRVDVARIPLGRFVTADEVAGQVGHVLLDNAAMTGQVLTIDGGMSVCNSLM